MGKRLSRPPRSRGNKNPTANVINVKKFNHQQISGHLKTEMDQHFQGVALKLAALLVNNVQLAVGDLFPIGWSLLTGDREYASVTEELLQEAHGLSATLECG